MSDILKAIVVFQKNCLDMLVNCCIKGLKQDKHGIHI